MECCINTDHHKKIRQTRQSDQMEDRGEGTYSFLPAFFVFATILGTAIVAYELVLRPQTVVQTPPQTNTTPPPPPSPSQVSGSKDDNSPPPTQEELLAARSGALSQVNKHVGRANWSNWAPGEPSGTPGVVMCLLASGGGLWYDESCDPKNYALCFDPARGQFSLTRKMHSGSDVSQIEEDCGGSGGGGGGGGESTGHFWRPLSPIQAEDAVGIAKGQKTWLKIGSDNRSVHSDGGIEVQYKKKRT